MRNYNHNSIIIPGQERNGFGVGGSQKGPQGSDDTQLDFSELWATIREGKWVILCTCLVVVAVVTAYTLMVTPVYEATSITAVDTQAQNQPGVYSVAASRGLSAEIGMLQNSNEIATRVVDGLRERAEVSGREHYPVLYDEDGNERPEVEIIDDLQEMTTFIGREEQGMIEISAQSENPEQAASIANLFAKAYEEYDVESSRASIRAARSFLEDQLERRQQELQELENRWVEFAQRRQVPTQGQDGQRLVDQYVELTGRRDELQFQLEQEEQALEVLRSQLDQFEPQLRESVADEQQAQQLQSEIESLNQRIAELSSQEMQFYINNPDLEGDRERIRREFPELAEIIRTKEGLQERKEQLIDQLIDARSSAAGTGEGGPLARVQQLQSQITEREMAIRGLRAQLAGIESVINSYSGRLDNLPQQTVEREQIERQMQQAERFLERIRNELQQTIIAEESELGSVRIVRQALVPNTPVSPNVQQNIILAILLGLGFGVGLAFLFRASDRRLRDPDDLHAHGYTLVGVIPKMDREIKASFKGKDTVEVEGRNVSTRLLPMHNPWSPIAENYRLVRTNLRHTSNGNPPQVLLITSPEMGDGKTLTCVNLAITVAQSGLRTLLIDGDLRRPAANKVLDLPLSPGLGEVLRRENEISESILPTQIEGMDFLPAGHTNVPPAEMLGSGRMRELLDELRESYDAVFIDSPPVLAVSDPVNLSTHCDTTLIVISADRTDEEALEITRQTLEAVDIHIGGVIINRFESDRRGGYSYGYQYGEEYEYRLTEA